MAKKYEITYNGQTIDFRKALANTRQYNENYGNTFSNLVYIATLPITDVNGVNDRCLDELFYRAYNYCRTTLQTSSGTASHFAELFKAKIKSYRQAQ